MAVKIYRINYKSDFILTLNSDAGWMTPFCIKFYSGAPSQAYYVGWDGTTYTHCAYDPSEPTKLVVQFDDHHLPIGDLKFQIAYHFTVADFPNDTEDEVINPASITTEIDGETYQVMLDFTGETAPEIEFSLPAYANEAQRIANEQQRIAAETQRIANEETRIANEQTRINQEQTRQQNEQQRINQEQARVNEYASLKADAVAATVAANDAAALANQKAQLAADKAALAQSAAALAASAAQLAADKAALAASAAQLANDKAALAQQKAEYAQQQGGYAKDQGDYAKAQGDTALADHQRAEADHGIAVDDHTQAGNDHTRAESDHGIAVDDHTQVGNDHTRAESDHGIAADDHTQAGNDHTRAESDHGIAADDHTQAGNDHTRAESDHTRAESDHDAVELYVDSLGVFDLSKHNAVGGVLATYADLDAALNALNALDSQYKYGGMSFKFVQSSDHKYVQYRYMDTSTVNADFVNVANWRGVVAKPVTGSKDLVESGGVKTDIDSINLMFGSIKFDFDVVNNTVVDKTFNVNIPANTNIQFGLDSAYVDSSGFNIWLYYEGGTDIFKISNHNITSHTTLQDIISVRIQRSKSGIIGTGNVMLTITNMNGIINDTLRKSEQSLNESEKNQVWSNLGIPEIIKHVDNVTSIWDESLVINKVVSSDMLSLANAVGLTFVSNTPSENNQKFKLAEGIYTVKIIPPIGGVVSSVLMLYNSSDEFISQTTFTTSSNEQQISISEEVAYIIYYIGNNDTCGSDGTIQISSTSNLITESKKIVDSILGKSVVVATLTTAMTSGYYYDGTGTLVENGSSKYCQPIDISQYAGKNIGLKIGIIGWSSSSGRYSLIIDSQNNVLTFKTEKQAQNNTLDLGILSADAKYLLISCTNNASITGVTLTKYFEDSKLSIVYVDADNGDDDNNGTSWSNAVQTIGKALLLSGDDVTINYTGISTSGVSITNKKKVSLFGKTGTVNRIVLGTKIDDATQYSGNVYKKSLTSFSDPTYNYLFQYGVNDADTLISAEERHPLHRGKTYRLDCSRIRKAASVQDVVDREGLTYYWDSTNNELYFKIADGTSLTDNPVYIPINGTTAINVDSVRVEISNIDCYFGDVKIFKTTDSIISNCAVKYVRSAGGFRYDNSIGIVFNKCEACCIFDGDGNGDGFNAHTSPSGSSAIIRRTTARLVDCWAHDVDDDGFSDHDCCESVVEGGLFEYNEKGGITPASGSHCIAFNVLSRKNWNGFFCAGPAIDGDVGTQMELFDCMAFDNKENAPNQHGFGFKCGPDATMILHNCKSRGNVKGYGFNSTDVGLMILNDCYSDGDTQVKRVGSGTITLMNSTLIEVV